MPRHEADRGHAGRAWAPRPRPALGVRHQGGRRPLDPLLLGCELRADLPRAAPPRAGGPDRGRERSARRPRATRVPAHGVGPRRPRLVAPRLDHDDRAQGRVAPAPVLRRRAAARAGPAAARRSPARARAVPARPPRDRRAAGHRHAVRRPGAALGNRLQRMGCAMVSGAAGAPGERAAGGLAPLTEPSFRGILLAGLPGFLREGFLPVGAFYAGLRLSGLAAGIGASAVLSVLVYLYERRGGRDGLLVRLSLLFVAVQSAVGLATDSTTVYLAQPVPINAAWGLAFLASVPLGRPLAGLLACAWYPFPVWYRETERVQRVFGVES